MAAVVPPSIPGELDVFAPFEALEVTSHILGTPRGIPGEFRDVRPVAVVRADEDHGMMRGASAQGSRARIKDAVSPLSVDQFVLQENAVPLPPIEQVGHEICPIAGPPRGIGIVLNVELPGEIVVLAGKGVKRRHLVFEGLLGAPGLEQENAESVLGQIRRNRPAAGT
jgi:hypothetical protein